MDTRPRRTHVVGTRSADGTHHTRKTQTIQFSLCQIQVFQTPAHLLATHHFAFTETLLRCADAFHAQHRTHRTAHVKHLPDFIFRACTLIFGVQCCQHIFYQFGIRFRTVLQCNGVVTFRTVGYVFHVGFSTRPPYAIHFFTGETSGLRFFNRGRIHHAPAPQHHVIGFILADLQPCGFLFHTGSSHGQQRQGETVHSSTFLQQRNGFFTEWAIVVNQGDFFAFELIHTTFFFADGLDDGISSYPVGSGNREVPFEDGTIGTFATTVTDGHHGYFVRRGFFGNRKGCTGRKRLHERHIFALQTLVAFHATGGVVAGFALIKCNFDSVDAATGIGQLEVIDKTIRPWNTVGRVRARAVGQHGDILLLRLRDCVTCYKSRSTQCK